MSKKIINDNEYKTLVEKLSEEIVGGIVKTASEVEEKTEKSFDKTASAMEALFGTKVAEVYVEKRQEKVAEDVENLFEKVAAHNNIEVDQAIEVLERVAVALEESKMLKIACNEAYAEAQAKEDAAVQVLGELGFDTEAMLGSGDEDETDSDESGDE